MDGNDRGQSWKERAYITIFENDTPGGKLFDVVLLVLILASVTTVMLDSIDSIREQYSSLFSTLEWIFTVLFTIEYGLRIACSPKRRKYISSFFGIIDALSVLPSYLGLLFGGAHYLMVVRVLRLLRIFRVLKLTRYLTEADVLRSALLASRPKIIVFLGAVLTSVVIIGAVMYLVEGPENGFTNIPVSIYWAIVTLTTVGYGDIAPRTPLGQVCASVVMILGYGIIAVPTGIVSVELHEASQRSRLESRCRNCQLSSHDSDARYCKRCGSDLSPAGRADEEREPGVEAC